MIRIESFEGNQAKVFATCTRGFEVQAGLLIKKADGLYFRRSPNVTGVNSWLREFWRSPEFSVIRKQYNLQEEAEAKAAMHAESEFYLEVKEALMAEGRAEHVAANQINTEAKLMAEARRTGVI